RHTPRTIGPCRWTIASNAAGSRRTRYSHRRSASLGCSSRCASAARRNRVIHCCRGWPVIALPSCLFSPPFPETGQIYSRISEKTKKSARTQSGRSWSPEVGRPLPPCAAGEAVRRLVGGAGEILFPFSDPRRLVRRVTQFGG